MRLGQWRSREFSNPRFSTPPQSGAPLIPLSFTLKREIHGIYGINGTIEESDGCMYSIYSMCSIYSGVSCVANVELMGKRQMLLFSLPKPDASINTPRRERARWTALRE